MRYRYASNLWYRYVYGCRPSPSCSQGAPGVPRVALRTSCLNFRLLLLPWYFLALHPTPSAADLNLHQSLGYCRGPAATGTFGPPARRARGWAAWRPPSLPGGSGLQIMASGGAFRPPHPPRRHSPASSRVSVVFAVNAVAVVVSVRCPVVRTDGGQGRVSPPTGTGDGLSAASPSGSRKDPAVRRTRLRSDPRRPRSAEGIRVTDGRKGDGRWGPASAHGQ